MSINVSIPSPRRLVPRADFWVSPPRPLPELLRRTKVGEAPPWPGPQGGIGQCDKREGASWCPEVLFV